MIDTKAMRAQCESAKSILFSGDMVEFTHTNKATMAKILRKETMTKQKSREEIAEKMARYTEIVDEIQPLAKFVEAFASVKKTIDLMDEAIRAFQRFPEVLAKFKEAQKEIKHIKPLNKAVKDLPNITRALRERRQEFSEVDKELGKKWRSIDRVISKDRRREEEIEFVNAPRHGERSAPTKKVEPPKQQKALSELAEKLLEKMEPGTIYYNRDIYKLAGEQFKVAAEFRRYPDLFKQVKMGQWRLKE